MKRKGLSQILYLIIAASVLMMIAMVITFTATDVIGGAGGQANDAQCTQAVAAKCAANPNAETTTLPTTCIDSEDRLLAGEIHPNADASGSGYGAGEVISSPGDTWYAECDTF
jgi:hypothetical protein